MSGELIMESTTYPSAVSDPNQKVSKEVLLTPGFKHPYAGDVVAIRAVDWGYEGEQNPATSAFDIVRGRVYGEVIVCNDEWITVASQVFDGGDVRCALSVPWVTVTELTILERVHGRD